MQASRPIYLYSQHDIEIVDVSQVECNQCALKTGCLECRTIGSATLSAFLGSEVLRVALRHSCRRLDALRAAPEGSLARDLVYMGLPYRSFGTPFSLLEHFYCLAVSAAMDFGLLAC